MPHIGLTHTRPYPFARLKTLFADVTPRADLKPISLGMGEPRHALPDIVRKAIVEHISSMSQYPATAGSMALREAIAQWCQRRYGVALNATTEIMPVLGSREALFSFVQSHIDLTRHAKPVVVIPSPFYQIYEGAALMALAEPVYVPLTADNHFTADLTQLDTTVLERTQIVFVCSPGNPTGKTMHLEDWKRLFDLSDRFGFVIASDECYSEIYFDEDHPPMGALTAAKMLGRDTFERLVVFQSLSKRSNVPGMRSGFVAGDAKLIAPYLLYRTYHGSAMNPMIQAASIAAWGDEAHVVANRSLYRDKFAAAQPVLNAVLDAPMPEASFYLWTRVPGSDEDFAKELYRQEAVTVLPGSYLSRPCADGLNPGSGFVRIALVAEPEEVREAIDRVVRFAQRLS